MVYICFLTCRSTTKPATYPAGFPVEYPKTGPATGLPGYRKFCDFLPDFNQAGTMHQCTKDLIRVLARPENCWENEGCSHNDSLRSVKCDVVESTVRELVCFGPTSITTVFVRNSRLVEDRTIAIAEHSQWIYRNISNFLILSLSRSPSRGRLLGSQNRISCADHRRLSTLKLACFGCLEYFPRVGLIYRHCRRKFSIIQFIIITLLSGLLWF